MQLHIVLVPTYAPIYYPNVLSYQHLTVQISLVTIYTKNDWIALVSSEIRVKSIKDFDALTEWKRSASPLEFSLMLFGFFLVHNGSIGEVEKLEVLPMVGLNVE